ncbi:hypothetical protein ASG67_14145 [Sphingomonas sp. Leaf339]|nr:hypothetical protein ASG67_14145 [Sphingomonas sp. Leaf339]
MNDFHDLSPLDFEELVRDLLQAHWSRRLESFGPGKDQGVDVRYLAGPERIVVQAKHYVRSGPTALVRAMGHECAKAAALQPSRYLLATSVSMTPSLKAQIVAAMPGVPLAEIDILGREDLNNLLGLHPEVEQRHFKLWLASSAVLERIVRSGVYNRTAIELDNIREMIPRFVQNRSVADAEALLAETGAMFIAGAPGVGKTTLAQMLLWRHAEQGWRIFVVDDVEEAIAVASEGERRLILFDDFLGQVRLSSDHVRGLDARLPPLLDRVAGQKDLRFILTTRDYILAAKAEIKAVPLYAELAAQHMAEAELNQKSYSTTEMYVRRHIVPKWGMVRLTDITSRDVAQWLAAKRAEGLAPATVEKIRVIMGRSFELGARWGIPGAEKNPTRGVPRKPLNNARERFLSAEEAGQLRDSGVGVEKPPAAAYCRSAVVDGCPRSRAARCPVGTRQRRTEGLADTDIEDGQASTRSPVVGGAGRNR